MMSSAELRWIVYGYCNGSARKLAKRIGCHPSTVWRNMRRAQWVTPWLQARIESTPLATAFIRGLRKGTRRILW